MKLKEFLGLLTLFLLSSHILSAAAIATRNLDLIKGDPSAHNLNAQGGSVMKLKDDDGKLVEVELGGNGKGRMEVEMKDYAGPGANPRHDPRNPPSVKTRYMDYEDPGANPRHDPRIPSTPPSA